MINFNQIPKDDLHKKETIKDESLWTIENVHDPAIYKDGEWYYVFSTDAQINGPFKPGIQIRKSRDLLNWQWVGRAFSEIPEDAKEWTGAGGLWAPEITKYGDTYYLYYSASQFGKNQSFIGVATSKQIEGPWEDQGEVIKTKQGPGPNAIDLNITFDKKGEPWMVYGSFFDGIYLKRIDAQTGKPLETGQGKQIARRHISVEGAIEGPFILYHPQQDYYYLFVSYDSLSSNYNIRVARSKEIEGPYVDINGNKMTNTTLPPNDVGMKILGGYKFSGGHGWTAPGHNSILKDGEEYYIVHHARTESYKGHFLHIRKLVWTLDGWPLALPERYAGETEEPIDLDELYGDWEYVYLDRNDNLQIESRTCTLSKRMEDSVNVRKAENSDIHFILSHLQNDEVEIVIVKGWDWENWHVTYVFSGKDASGNVFIGKKVKNNGK